MISCAQAAELISRTLEIRLTWGQRFVLRLHLFGCDLCRRFRRQIRLVEDAGRRLEEGENDGISKTGLPEEARRRIQGTIAQAQPDGLN